MVTWSYQGDVLAVVAALLLIPALAHAPSFLPSLTHPLFICPPSFTIPHTHHVHHVCMCVHMCLLWSLPPALMGPFVPNPTHFLFSFTLQCLHSSCTCVCVLCITVHSCPCLCQVPAGMHILVSI